MNNEVFWSNRDQQGKTYGPIITDEEQEEQEDVWHLSFTQHVASLSPISQVSADTVETVPELRLPMTIDIPSK